MKSKRTNKSNALRVVLDTNVLVSAAITRGNCSVIFKLVLAGELTHITSDAILAELAAVLSRPYFFSRISDVPLFLALVEQSSTVVFPASIDAVVLADPSDDKFFACAFAGAAQCIVSGDQHLLSLVSFRGVALLSPAAFLHEKCFSGNVS